MAESKRRPLSGLPIQTVVTGQWSPQLLVQPGAVNVDSRIPKVTGTNVSFMGESVLDADDGIMAAQGWVDLNWEDCSSGGIPGHLIQPSREQLRVGIAGGPRWIPGRIPRRIGMRRIRKAIGPEALP